MYGGVKGDDLVNICSMYENYRFRTPQRLFRTASLKYPDDSATGSLRFKEEHRDRQSFKHFDDRGLDVSHKHPTGNLQIKPGDNDEFNALTKLRRCRIGDDKKMYKHDIPPLMITSNKLPSIFKQVRYPVSDSETKQGLPTDKVSGKEPFQYTPLTGTTDGKQNSHKDRMKDGDERTTKNGTLRGKKKVVSFGGVRIIDDRKFQQGLRQHPSPSIHSIHLKHPTSRKQDVDSWAPQKLLLPRRGKLQVRFSGKRCKPFNPTTARLKADSAGGVKPSKQVVPHVGVSILKQATQLMVIPTPCFPCSPEFEHAFRSIRGHQH